MAYQSKYNGEQIDSKLDNVDTITDNIESIQSDLNTKTSQINTINSNISNINSSYKIKTYTDPTIFGLSYDTMTMQDIVDALPNNTILTFWVNGKCPNIYDSVCEGVGTTNGYGNISFKKIQNATRIIFEQYGSNVTLTYNYTTTNSIGWSSTGWGLNAYYPIGTIYQSVNSTSPASLFGGTWEKIEGRFLFASNSNYVAGFTGGATTHTLTANQMPSHYHTELHWGVGGKQFGVNPNSTSGSNSQWYFTYSSDSTAGISQLNFYTGYTGGSAAHNNMPPYLAIYMWKRVA